MLSVRESWTARPASVTLDDLLARAGGAPFALLHGRGEWTLLALRPLVAFDAPDWELQVERAGAVPPIRPDLVGHVTYEYGYGLEPRLASLAQARAPREPGGAEPRPHEVPAFRFVLHGEVLLRHAPSGTLYEAERHVDGGAAGAATAPRLGAGDGPFRTRKLADSDDPARYAAKVEAVRDAIRRGDVYQVNLTRQEHWAAAGDPVDLARRLAELNPAPYSALLADPAFTLVSSSPECFLSLREGLLATRPIKGTAARGPGADDPFGPAAGADDEARRAALAASAKDRAELTMIVDLCRNDLARACDPLTVRPRPFPETLSVADVHHLVATVEGRLAPGRTFEDLLRALFPAGSITGCPKIAAMQAIRGLEPWPRGLYTGAIGWVAADVSQLELSVAIRTATVADGALRFGVGGGIVWDSEPRAEYEETVHKSRAILRALSSFAS